MKLPRRVVRWALPLAILALAYFTRGWTLPLAGTWLDVGEKPRPAEYVVVLGGDVNTRPFVAAALVRAGLARVVLVSHVAILPDAPPRLFPPEEELARGILTLKGVPPERIHRLGRDNRTTYDEARALAEFLHSAPPGQVLVPTSAFHTRRTRWVLHRILGDKAKHVSMVSIPSETFRLESWWRSEEGFRTVIGENLKLAFYLVRYSGPIVPAGMGAAVLAGAILWWVRRRRKKSPQGQPAECRPSAHAAPAPTALGDVYLGLPPSGGVGSSGDSSPEGASSSPGNPR